MGKDGSVENHPYILSVNEYNLKKTEKKLVNKKTFITL